MISKKSILTLLACSLLLCGEVLAGVVVVNWGGGYGDGVLDLNIPAGATAFWAMLPPGTNVSDELVDSIGGHNGTLGAGGARPTYDGTNSFHFDDGDDIAMDGEADFDVGTNDPITCVGWAKRDDNDSGAFLAKQLGSGAFSGVLCHQSGTGGDVGFGMVGNPITQNIDVSWNGGMANIGEWYHIVITKSPGLSADTILFYIDGVKGNVITTNSDDLASSPLNNVAMRMGNREGLGYPMTGALSTWLVYPRVLSLSEINDLFDRDKASFGK